ncbi:MAG: LamG-like jellyroll fold domain-containing protein [Paenisporosarcina sp.]
MATITGLTAERMAAIEAASVVDGDVVGNDLILTKHDGSTINAGNVRGPTGPVGPAGSNLAVVSDLPVLEPGLANQIRAGRTLLPIDFTNMGLAAPIGLWNLSDLTDVSGNGRNLINKGSVPFGIGINGVAASAAVFSGAVAQGLYIADTGVSDPFRVKTISYGCWFRTGKQGIVQDIMGKWGQAAGQGSFLMEISALPAPAGGAIGTVVSTTGSDSPGVQGYTDVCDDRWHFAVVTYDGIALKVYVDGILENMGYVTNVIFAGSGSFTIGGRDVTAAQNGVQPFYGRVDEAFVTSDVLSDDQIRNLYCAKIAHTLGSIPVDVNLNVKRQRRGAALVSADFPSQPLRLHNFTGGALTDQGSGGVSLVSNPATGAIVSAAAADGAKDGAFTFLGAQQGLSSTDVGLPVALATRSYGCWFKTYAVPGPGQMLVVWGSSSQEARLWTNLNGDIACTSQADTISGRFVADGNWHFAVVVENDSASDGVKRKVYVDGRLTVGSTLMGIINGGGANRFRVGAWLDGSSPFNGQIDSVFVHNIALTPEQIAALYVKSSQALGRSPKDAGYHIESMDAGSLYAIFDGLENNALVSLAVAS